MRFGIGAKLGLLASALIVATVLILAWLMMSWSRDALTRQELAALGDETRLRGEELLNGLQELREDALRQAGRSALRDFLQVIPAQQGPLRDSVRRDFRDLLASHPRYLQVEFLPAEGGEPTAPLTAARDGQNVQIDSKAHLKYFRGLKETRDNAVWLSEVRRTPDARVGGKEVPVLRAAAPLFANGRYAGSLVITANFLTLAKVLRRSARHLVYLTDEQGRLLWSPDPDKSFAFEKEDAPRIGDTLLPDLKRFYSAGNQELTSGPARWRGYRYPDPDRDGTPLGRYYLLRLEAVRPDSWQDQKELHEELDRYLQGLSDEGGLAASRSEDPGRAVSLRGQDAGRTRQLGQQIVDQFRPHLALGKEIACDHYAVHFLRLPYTLKGTPPHWFGLAQAVAREEIVAGISDKTAGVLWLKLALIVVGVSVAFLLSRRLTRPLQRMTEATRNLARGDGDGDIDLPIEASDEIGVLARSFKDMVEQLRQRGQQLREGEARLRAILKTAAEGIFILDDDGKIEMVNQAAERLFGYAADEILGQNVKLLLPKEVQGLPRGDGAVAGELGTSSIRMGRVNNRTQEAIGRRKDGSVFTLELAVSEVPRGDRRLYTGIVRDVTKRKRAEAEIHDLNQHLRQLNEQLDRRVRERTRQLERSNDELAAARDQALDASRAKSQFLAQMSHELRTPLNAIKGYSELLLEEAEERELYDFVPDLNKVIEAGKHLLALINDVLDLSKIEAHKIELFLESFEVKAVVDAVTSAVGPLAKKNGNELVVRCADAGSMYADRTRVRQVLANLLSNACKFTHEGRVELEVLRQPYEGRDGLVFRVRDTGIGIRPEQLGKLFKPFSQVDDSTTRQHDGTGLGLAISRSFCQMMGGDIIVESVPGKGSVFAALLPVQVSDARDGEAVAPSGEPGGSTVLVVDDDPAARDLMQRYLDKEGFRAVTAANGREGLRLARQLRPRAITLDVMMPGLDGWDVLTALKADPGTADIPVIMVTIADDRGLGHALGADEYMTKPIDRERLAELLKRYQTEGAVPDV